MNFLSKEAPLQQSISQMKAVLADVGCEVLFLEEKNPLTHCFSVNLSSKEAPPDIFTQTAKV